ncbi:hypothetical protein PtA15_15A426 [Puccinia triticina]|uniref:Uncharacterized protein n=1 Tax=Puccinia triticina TaxID=208348 RepID=A0ABY7D354_9BASI|nr:uncharacterized protein PtA15_15A426 [Puccinia triticina]WAQ92031.1 hypothetical protein PtA15_15A426 [Puccinia triticina]WAR62846.1 hypothetical protein PtB15_15B434 [Puccinia triticina]
MGNNVIPLGRELDRVRRRALAETWFGGPKRLLSDKTLPSWTSFNPTALRDQDSLDRPSEGLPLL